MKYLSIFVPLLLLGFGCVSSAPIKTTDAPTTYDSVTMVDNTTTTTSTIDSSSPDLKNNELNIVAVSSFEGCVSAGNPIMESYPRQCRHTDGKLYIETIAPTPQPSSVAPSISISGKVGGAGVTINWILNNLDSPQGFKVVYAMTPNPTYGQDTSVYIEHKNTRSHTLPLNDGKTYYFRVCSYVGDGCVHYSNAIKLTANGVFPSASNETNTFPEEVQDGQSSAVTSISLSAGSNGTINWNTIGDANMGFKIAYSKNPNPVYPKRNEEDNWIFVWDPNATTWKLPAEQGTGTYYVRVCEYIGNACGVYSNEISIQL